MLSQEIRRAFIKYFQSKGHTKVPSSPVIPHDDPSLLFINAGMNQFKDVFLGKSKRDYTKAVSSQKCIRVGGKHNDLDNVGHTARHLTFFEMLGNFSFGDYFKKEAIQFAWEVSTEVFVFDPSKIWVSVFQDDDEAYNIWENIIPKERIVRMGEKDNFWTMGDTGPCGPCSELYYDLGEKKGPAKSPLEDPEGTRYLEFWNLVFMQYDRDSKGEMKTLPKQSIDTGAGLERVVSLKLGVDSVFQTDILRGIIAETENLSKVHYDPLNKETAPAFHVIADHLRSLSFAIADGVQPSNTDRGYVLRKVLRRASRYGRTLGLQKPFLADLLPRLVGAMGDDFPELKTAKQRITEILTLEEEGFIRTLSRGGNMLNKVIASSHEKGKKLSGDAVFQLKDTYGFPIEEIQLIAKDENLNIDLVRYSELEKIAKETSKKAQKKVEQNFDSNFFESFLKTHSASKFVGYDKSSCKAKVLGILIDQSFVDSIKKGQKGSILLNETPFYAEMGGQVGDSGRIRVGSNVFEVETTTSPYPGMILHTGKMKEGEIEKGNTIEAGIDEEKREITQNNHTATHLLHLALQEELGEHVKQAGSVVDSTRLRFDFSHHKQLSKKEIRSIEMRVNRMIRKDKPVETYEMAYKDVQKREDIKQFFGDKYGEKVRVVDVSFSKELCGGTHTSRTGTIGLFKIAKEMSIASGVRRIEAVTGIEAEKLFYEKDDLIEKISLDLKTQESSLSDKVTSLLEENKALLQEVKEMRKEELSKMIERYFLEKEALTEKSFLIAKEVSLKSDEISSFADLMLQRLGSGVVAIGVKSDEKCQILVAISPDLVAKNLHAGKLIQEIAPMIQGGGGGKPGLAQAGGKKPEGLALALEKVREIAKKAGS